MIKKNKKIHEVQTLSNGLMSVIEDIAREKNCPISKYLSNINRLNQKVKHFYQCDIFSAISFVCKDNDVSFSFVPEKHVEAGEAIRQYGSPSKIINTLINDKRPTEKIPVIKVEIPVQNNDMSITMKPKSFWFDEKFGISYNDAENLFEIPDEQDFSSLKLQNKQFTLFKTDEYEAFANYTKNNFLCGFEFKVLRGADIAKYYHMSHYFNKNGEKGTLWNSCMRNKSAKEFLYYTENKDAIGLLVAMFEGKILGRALLWNSTEGPVLDRIYSYEDYIYQSFIDYCQENHITYKKHATSAGHEDEWMVYNKETKVYEHKRGYPIEIIIDKSYYEFSNPPYIDTFYCTFNHGFKKIDGKRLLTNYRWRSPETGDLCGNGRDFSWGRKTPLVLI